MMCVSSATSGHLRQPSALPGVPQQRPHHLGGDVRPDPGEQRRLGAVVVPPADRAELPLAVTQPVDLAVEAGVATVGVADRRGVQEDAVERRVEERAARVRCRPGCGPGRAPRPRRAAASVPRRGTDQPGSSASRLVRAPRMLTNETPTWIRATRSLSTFTHAPPCAAAPGAVPAERLVEAEQDVDPVAVGRAAEAAAGRTHGDLATVEEPDRRRAWCRPGCRRP